MPCNTCTDEARCDRTGLCQDFARAVLPERCRHAARWENVCLRCDSESNGATEYASWFPVASGVAVPVAPKLAVWFGPMPESNGKANWTAILHRGDISASFTIERSEYHDRVRYEADRVRFLIGELAEEPDILAYDANMLSPPGWVHPCGVGLTVGEEPAP